MRSQRADAARNRRLLLAAAADEFAQRGLDASVADIARRAGVGKGTVFRHFPTKDDLITAIVLDRVAELNTVGEKLLGHTDPDAALFEFLTVAARQRQQRDLSFLGEAAQDSREIADVRAEMARIVQALVDRARDHGTVRDDVTGTDIILLMCAPNYVISYVPDAPADLWKRYLAIIFDGLRREGARPLPHPPPASV